jgi:uncharacterized repeat protein (TIGR01451 family)
MHLDRLATPARRSVDDVHFFRKSTIQVTVMKRNVLVFFVALLSLGFGLMGKVSAQSWVSEANSSGFTLKKVVSDTAIATGQNFSYTVYFSIPAGATNVTISDALPSSVTFQAISVTSACGSPVTTTPAVGSSGTVTLSWASVPSGCSGSFVITVQFPNGVTCNGASARNNVCMTGMLGGLTVDFCTGFVLTTAIASNPWNINKWVVGAGSQPGPCPKVTADSLITYQICVYKNVGVTGQLNMHNAVVYDTLPPGAMLVSSTCGATQSGNIVTWNIGAMSALPMYNTLCCSYTVLYPPSIFPTGTQITNSATLQGVLGAPNSPCGPAQHTSQTTCVEIKTVTSATMSKWVYTNGQPGCTGKYRIWICNNGSVPITTLTITDTIPSPLTGLALGTVSSGLLATLVGNVVTVTLSTPLSPTQCRYFEVDFTIPISATIGTPVNNCAYLSIPGNPPLVACAPFTISAPAPTPCVWKEVCSKQPSYSPGSVFRYRLRVQNIGGQPLTGASITDVLDPNLEYVGNPSYYSATAWNAPCTNVSNWPGVTLSQSGNTLNFSLPTIPATCQNIFYGHCGMYGAAGVPFYFIEFDVKVSDTSALGNIPNRFTIAGGNLSGPTLSNFDYVNVVGTSGFSLDKGVAIDTTSWASSLNAAAGSNVNYRLNMTVAPGSVGLRHITFADLLPRDDSPNDNLILGPCSPRGSAFNIGYTSPILTLPSAVSYRNTSSFANVNVFAPAGAPGSMFTTGCGTAGSWAPGILSLDRNLGWYFGATPIGAGNNATVMFTATVDPSAHDHDIACNSFAANAAVRHLINSVLYTDQKTGNLESGLACVTAVKDTSVQTECFTVQAQSVISTGVDASGDCTYDIVISISNPGPATTGYFESSQGNVSPMMLSIPTGTSIDTLTFTDTPPVDSLICIRYGILTATGLRILCDSICVDLPPCHDSDPCDSLRAQLDAVTTIGVNANGDCTYSVDISFSNTSSSPTQVWFDSFQGTVAPAVLTIPVGASTQTVTFTDTPPADAFVCIRYGVFAGTQPVVRVVCDSICFDVTPCDTDDDCDSLKASLQSVTTIGPDSHGDCTYSVDLSFTNTSSSPLQVWFDSFGGTVTPAALTIPVGTSTQTLTFTDTPPADAFVCIRYGVFQGIQPPVPVVCDSICFDLTPCDKESDCDSLRAELKDVTTVGVDASGNCTYSVDISFTNTSTSSIQVWFDSYQGSVAPPAMVLPTGTSTQTLTFTDTPPVDVFACIRYGVYVGPQPVRQVVCDSVCFEIKPCDTFPCDSLINTKLDECCAYSGTIVNASSTPITSISYSISGGTLTSFTTFPCTPTAPAPTGSTSGILTYSPACLSNIQFILQVNPTTPTSVITVTLVIHHERDSCIIRFQYTCDRKPLIRCDTFTVKPFVAHTLKASGRSFTIMNTKVPASPITHIDITPTPTPCNLIGGGLSIDYTSTPWPAPYTRIPASGFISANSAVSFNLAIDYVCNWTGNVQIVVHHADGDSCIYNYGPWKAGLAVGTGVVLTDPIKARVYANHLSVQNPAGQPPVKWVSINVENTADVIIAGSGKHWSGTNVLGGHEALEDYEQGATEALFTFDTPISAGTTSEYFNLVVARDSAVSGSPVIRWTTYDADGNALATDTISITTSVLSVRGGSPTSSIDGFELLHSFPNPAMQSATINYLLGRNMSIQLELFNQLGERVRVIRQGYQDAGLHTQQVDLSLLPPGQYYILLASDGRHVSRPLIIAR